MTSSLTQTMAGLIAPLVLIGAVFAAWGWDEGAYFGTTFYPGALVVAALLVMLALGIRLRAPIRGPALLALGCLLGIAGLLLASTLWTSAPSSGPEDAQRALLYAGAFLAGLWICNMLGKRMALVLWPVAGAGIVVAVGIFLVLATGDSLATYFHDDVTLKAPLGYRNANATFFLICLWPLLTLAADIVERWWGRMLLIGAGTLMVDIVILSQSRGSLPAAAIALGVFIATSRRSLRAAVYAALVVLPAIPAIPALLDVFQYGTLDAGLIDILRTATQSIALSVIGSMILAAAFFLMVEARIDIGREGVQRVSRIAAVGALAVALVGGAAFAQSVGGPIDFLDQRVDEFRNEGNPNFSEEGVRFGANVGSNRSDFWAVSLEQVSSNPLLGGGAGDFRFAYLRDRDSPETPDDPHSVEMLMLSELGLVGLALFLVFCVAATRAALRSRSLGPKAIAVSTAALAAGAQWFVHSSYDWFWHYPAVTAPAMFLLGAAAAPRLLDPGRSLRGRRRDALVAGIVIAALSCVPFFLSDRLLEDGTGLSQTDPAAAVRELDRAADLNPLAAQPLLVKGVVLSRLGESGEAIEAFREAADRQPDNYATHYFLAKELRASDPAAAAAEVQAALELNPRGPEVKALQRRLAESGESAPG